MRVETMRMLDRWIGSPVCRCLSLVHRLAPVRRRPSQPREVLIILLSEMGSLALAAPSVRLLRERYPDARVRFLIFKRNHSFLTLLHLVDEDAIWEIDDSSLGGFVRSALACLGRARREGIDTVLDFELFSRASAILSYLTGAPVRCGFSAYRAEGLYRGGLETHPVFYNTHHHISLNFAAQVEALRRDPRQLPLPKVAIELDTRLPKHRPAPEALDAMAERLRRQGPTLKAETPLVVLSPFSGNLLSIRAWPIAHYITFVRHLFEAIDDVAVVVIGLEEARAYCAPLFRAVDDPRLIDFIGHTHDIADVVHLIHLARLFISADSGPPHFASLTPTPTLTLFGPECPRLYAPLGDNVETVFLDLACSPCVTAFNHRDTPCQDNQCMKGIDPERVTRWALDRLGEAGARSR